MKFLCSKFSFLAAALALVAFASCSKQQVPAEDDYADVTFAVSSSSLTRATIDEDGQAAGVTRYICEVYNEGDLYMRRVNVVAAGTLETTFELRLVKSHDYEVLFWADTADGEDDLYYKTVSSLKAISLVDETLGNNDALDAFFAKDEVVNLAADYEKTIVLTRPFAQLNVITNDIEDIRESLLAAKMEPESVTVAVKAPVTFNVSTGKAGEAKELEYTADVYYAVSGKNATPYYTLSMCYLFADETKAVEDVDFAALNGGETLTECTFNNIPLQRNYRTNIIGSVLTNASEWKVIIDPEWETPDYDIEY